MGNRLNWEKKKTPRDAIQIGADDDASTSFGRVWKQVRARLTEQRPDLPRDEIERRVKRIMQRGMRPAA
jgi:hypothetical protein